MDLLFRPDRRARDSLFDTHAAPSRGDGNPGTLVGSERCPFDEAVLAFAQGRLERERLDPIDEHLSTCNACQAQVLELLRSSRPAHDPFDDGSWGAACTFAPGVCVSGRYRICRVLGRGGMGEVYEALDTLLGLPIALKTLVATQCDSPKAFGRLIAEARIARRVSHPNVCRTYNAGLHEDARRQGERLAFVTMELIRGEPLGRRVRSCGRLPLDEARCIGREILHGLCALHRAGIVHRDVKADNVIVCDASNAERRAAIVDLGLAVELASQQRSSASRAEAYDSGPEGTLAYMAPEQLAGHAVTPATDVYGFGACLFEMITGETPFARSPPGSRRYPSPHATRALCVARLGSTPLQRFLEVCLDVQPSERFTDAHAAVSAFDQAWA